MKRSMISGLALAGVVGSAGAAFAGVATHDTGTPSAQAQGPAATGAEGSAQAAGVGQHDRTIVYQVGAAGTVAVTVSGPTISATNVTAGSGWSLVGTSGPAAHLEVQFTDTLQLVTFSADLVGDEVVVGVSNAPAAGAPSTTAASAPITVTVISLPRPAASTPAPQPATPTVPSVSPPTSAHDDDSDHDSDDDSSHASHDTAPAAPAPAATTAPSGGGSEVGDDDDDHGDDHGDSEDHGDDEEHEDD